MTPCFCLLLSSRWPDSRADENKREQPLAHRSRTLRASSGEIEG